MRSEGPPVFVLTFRASGSSYSTDTSTDKGLEMSVLDVVDGFLTVGGEPNLELCCGHVEPTPWLVDITGLDVVLLTREGAKDELLLV